MSFADKYKSILFVVVVNYYFFFIFCFKINIFYDVIISLSKNEIYSPASKGLNKNALKDTQFSLYLLFEKFSCFCLFFTSLKYIHISS